MTPVLLIDMDDTLYSEASYVESGFRTVADFASTELITGRTPDQLSDQMRDLMQANGRGRVFNDLLTSHGVDDSGETIQHLISLYRNHTPDISLHDGVYDLLSYLKGRYKLVLVTDGLPLMQVQKAKALELDILFDALFYTWTYAAKPKAESYGHPVQALNLPLDHCLIIGDNPINDGQPAAKLGIPFWQIYSERQTRSPYAERLLMQFTDLGPVLEEI